MYRCSFNKFMNIMHKDMKRHCKYYYRFDELMNLEKNPFTRIDVMRDGDVTMKLTDNIFVFIRPKKFVKIVNINTGRICISKCDPSDSESFTFYIGLALARARYKGLLTVKTNLQNVVMKC